MQRGQFNRATQDEIDQAAEITPADIERAKQAWRDDSSPEFRDLLDAQPMQPKRNRKPQ